MTESPARVAVAMSGGVDSSVAAALLKQAGQETVGVTMRLPTWSEGPEAEAACCGVRGIDDARRVAGKLGIPFYVLDFREEFRRTVVADFCRAYAQGRTPNPCVRCNEWVKFGALLCKARGFGCDYLATGHYVRKAREERTGRFALSAAGNGDDQSYFLFCLTQKQLGHALFPLGDRTKKDARRIARELELPVHDKPKSQDLCFLPDGKYREFLRAECPDALRPGPLVHVSGKVIGQHEGIAAYTVGQRRGLGIAHAEPLYVIGFRLEDNAVVVGERQHTLSSQITVEDVNWLVDPPQDALSARVKIRYNHPGADAEVRPMRNGQARVVFDEPQEAPCPGQAAVFYQDDLVLGGGTIEASFSDQDA